MAASSLPVEHLFTLMAQTSAPANTGGGPQGGRLIVNVLGGSFEGPKLKGKVLASGGDWLTARADGSLKLDVRITLQTDDGATILMTYQGIGRDAGSGFELRTAPLFETGDERYAWLGGVQAVATGTPQQGGVTYEVYQLL